MFYLLCWRKGEERRGEGDRDGEAEAEKKGERKKMEPGSLKVSSICLITLYSF